MAGCGDDEVGLRGRLGAERSATVVGDVSLVLSYSLMTPARSATNTRPSGANAMAVGVLSPLNTVATWNPGSMTVARAI
jgi:hypothetical protein